jgi:hypothetical protein
MDSKLKNFKDVGNKMDEKRDNVANHTEVVKIAEADFNSRNTTCMPACPIGPLDRTRVVKIIVFLDLNEKP